jgi:hypothetical protein
MIKGKCKEGIIEIHYRPGDDSIYPFRSAPYTYAVVFSTGKGFGTSANSGREVIQEAKQLLKNIIWTRVKSKHLF